LDEWPRERREQIWGIGRAGETLDRFGSHSITSRLLAVRPLDLGFILGPVAFRLAARKARATVFHATDPYRPWLNGRIRQIVTVYDLIPLREPEMLASWRPHHRHTYHLFLEQIRHADLVVANSKTTAADVCERLGIPPERIAVVSPVVTAPAAAPLWRPPSSPAFLYVGGLDVTKQPELAIEALVRFREHHGEGRLEFVGPSSREQRAALCQRAATLGVLDSITFRGHISDADLDIAFTSCTALLSTSRIEGFGLPAVEAALRGVPVVAVDIPASRETVGAAATLVPPEAGAIAQALADARPGPSDVRDSIRERYSRRSSAEALWTAYQRLM